MPHCPHCSQTLLTEATPCPRCKPDGASFSVGGILGMVARDPIRAEMIQLLDRLEEIAPALVRWRTLPEPRGPQPDIHPRHRAEVEHINERAAELKAMLRARK